MITLEPRVAAHADALFPLLADPALYEYLDDAPPESVEVLRVRFARSETRRSPDGSEHWLNWVVRDAEGRVAGFVQATVEASGDTNVAYVMGTAFRGRGLATEAVGRMLEMVEAEFGVKRFFIVADRRNARSIRLARRLGFVEADEASAGRRSVLASDVLLQRR